MGHIVDGGRVNAQWDVTTDGKPKGCLHMAYPYNCHMFREKRNERQLKAESNNPVLWPALKRCPTCAKAVRDDIAKAGAEIAYLQGYLGHGEREA